MGYGKAASGILSRSPLQDALRSRGKSGIASGIEGASKGIARGFERKDKREQDEARLAAQQSASADAAAQSLAQQDEAVARAVSQMDPEIARPHLEDHARRTGRDARQVFRGFYDDEELEGVEFDTGGLNDLVGPVQDDDSTKRSADTGNMFRKPTPRQPSTRPVNQGFAPERNDEEKIFDDDGLGELAQLPERDEDGQITMEDGHLDEEAQQARTMEETNEDGETVEVAIEDDLTSLPPEEPRKRTGILATRERQIEGEQRSEQRDAAVDIQKRVHRELADVVSVGNNYTMLREVIADPSSDPTDELLSQAFSQFINPAARTARSVDMKEYGGVTQQVMDFFGRLKEGYTLSPGQRRDMLQTMDKMMEGYLVGIEPRMIPFHSEAAAFDVPEDMRAIYDVTTPIRANIQGRTLSGDAHPSQLTRGEDRATERRLNRNEQVSVYQSQITRLEDALEADTEASEEARQRAHDQIERLREEIRNLRRN